MTAKEKAKELVSKYHKYSKAKEQCALIAVDEILAVIKHTFYDKYYKYWEEVKQEIEKL